MNERYSVGTTPSLVINHDGLIRKIQESYEMFNSSIASIEEERARKLTEVTRKYGSLPSNLTEEERKEILNRREDEFQSQYNRVMASDLSDEEKRREEDEIFAEFGEEIELYEEFGALSEREKDKFIDNKRKQVIYEAFDKTELAKKEFLDEVVKEASKEIRYLAYMLRKYNNPKEIYESYKKIANLEELVPGINIEALKSEYSNRLRETMMNYFDLENVIISYSELEAEIISNNKESKDDTPVKEDDLALDTPVEDNPINNPVASDKTVPFTPNNLDNKAPKQEPENDIDMDEPEEIKENDDDQLDPSNKLSVDELKEEIKSILEGIKENSDYRNIVKAVELAKQLPEGPEKEAMLAEVYNSLTSIIHVLIDAANDKKDENLLDAASNYALNLPDGSEYPNSNNKFLNGTARKEVEERIKNVRDSLKKDDNQIDNSTKPNDEDRDIFSHSPDSNDDDLDKEPMISIDDNSVPFTGDNNQPIDNDQPVNINLDPNNNNNDDIGLDDNVEPVKKKGKLSNIKWKSIAAIVAGGLVGLGVSISATPIELAVFSGALIGTKIAGGLVEKSRARQAELQRLGEPVQIESIEDMEPGLQKNWAMFKQKVKKAGTKIGDLLTNKYFKMATTSAVITGAIAETAATIWDHTHPVLPVKEPVDPKLKPAPTENTGLDGMSSNNQIGNTTSAEINPLPTQTADTTTLNIGDSLEGFDLTHGNVTAAGAGTETDVSLLQDVMNKAGVHVGRYNPEFDAYGVQDANGVDLAWVAGETIAKGKVR